MLKSVGESLRKQYVQSHPPPCNLLSTERLMVNRGEKKTWQKYLKPCKLHDKYDIMHREGNIIISVAFLTNIHNLNYVKTEDKFNGMIFGKITDTPQ